MRTPEIVFNMLIINNIFIVPGKLVAEQRVAGLRLGEIRALIVEISTMATGFWRFPAPASARSESAIRWDQ